MKKADGLVHNLFGYQG